MFFGLFIFGFVYLGAMLSGTKSLLLVMLGGSTCSGSISSKSQLPVRQALYFLYNTYYTFYRGLHL